MATRRSINVPRLLKALNIDATDRGGGELWACCPFDGHTEKTGSWSIRSKEGDPSNSHHHCFGCGRGGGSADLVVMHMNVSYQFAREWMTNHDVWDDRAFGFDISLNMKHAVSDEYHLPLDVECVGNMVAWADPAREFAIRRGVSISQVARWGIGFARFGKLAGRIVIPIRDPAGNLRNHTARSYRNHHVKYLSGSKSDGADSGALFGSHLWSDDRDVLYLSEGALNALANERVGARSVAALDGSALLPSHLLAIGTFARIVVVSDPDVAGDKVWNSLQGLARWRTIERALLPPDTDSNDIERTDPNLLRSILGVDLHPQNRIGRNS